MEEWNKREWEGRAVVPGEGQLWLSLDVAWADCCTTSRQFLMPQVCTADRSKRVEMGEHWGGEVPIQNFLVGFKINSELSPPHLHMQCTTTALHECSQQQHQQQEFLKHTLKCSLASCSWVTVSGVRRWWRRGRSRSRSSPWTSCGGAPGRTWWCCPWPAPGGSGCGSPRTSQRRRSERYEKCRLVLIDRIVNLG